MSSDKIRLSFYLSTCISLIEEAEGSPQVGYEGDGGKGPGLRLYPDVRGGEAVEEYEVAGPMAVKYDPSWSTGGVSSFFVFLGEKRICQY